MLWLAFLCTTTLVFWGLWKGYFQQDEWSGFGKVIYAQKYGLTSLVGTFGSHFTPLTVSTMYLMFKAFSLNHFGYAAFSLLFHSINGLLVYFLALSLLRNTKFALLSSIFFLSAYTPHQAVSWYAASMSFLPSGFFALVSLILYERFLNTSGKKLLLFSLASVLIAAGFRENAIFLLGFFPIRAFILEHKFRKTVFWYSLTAAAFYLTLRFGTRLIHLVSPEATENRIKLVEIPQQALRFIFIYLPHLFVPEPFLRMLELIGQFFLGSRVQFIYKTFYTNIFYIATSTAITILLTLLRKPLTLNLAAFLLLSVLPFSFLPVPLIMESRHFYLSSIGASILLGYIVMILIKKTFWKLATIAFCLVFILFNISLVQKDLIKLRTVSAIRINTIGQLIATYPRLPERVIFLAQGSTLPFQSGPGQTMMVAFHVNQKSDYTELFKTRFLYGIDEQGYREEGQTGFGFYTDYSLALSEYCKQGLKPDNFFSFAWSDVTREITDTSEVIRGELICPKDRSL